MQTDDIRVELEPAQILIVKKTLQKKEVTSAEYKKLKEYFTAVE